MRRTRAFLAALACFALVGCPASPKYLAQPQPFQAQDSYVHTPSQMIFPPSIGDFRRVDLIRYDPDGLDVSAGYNLAAPSPMVATVYIYPAPSLVSIGSPPDVVASARATLCNAEFERRKKEIVASHPGATLIGEGDVAPPQSGPALPGKMAGYEYQDTFQGLRQPLHSELYVYCYVGGKWAFEYRFTSLKDYPARDAISTFMAGLTWTVPSSP